MKKFIALVLSLAVPLQSILAALILSTAPVPAAAAPSGHSFCKDGVVDIIDAADRTAESLKLDPTGHRPLRGCIATPLDYLVAWQKTDPWARIHLTRLDQLVAFMRDDLVPTESRKGVEYWSACLRGTPTNHEVDGHCAKRVIGEKDEKVYANRHNGKIDFQTLCANTTDVPDEPAPPCKYIKADIVDGDEDLSNALFSKKAFDMSSPCFTYQGEGDATPVPMYQVANYDCGMRGCDLKNMEAVLHMTHRYAKNVVVGPHYVIIGVSAEFADRADTAVVLCLHRHVNDNLRDVIVRKGDYVNGKAYVYQEGPNTPPNALVFTAKPGSHGDLDLSVIN